MKNKLMLLTAASAFSMAGIAADYTNIVLINLDDVGYGDFSFNGAYGYTTPNIVSVFPALRGQIRTTVSIQRR